MTSKTNRKVVMIDVDMVVCDNRERLMRCLTSDKKVDHEKFYQEKEMETDKVIPGAIDALNFIRQKYQIIFLTARSLRVKEFTHAWLIKNELLKDGDELLVVESPQSNKIPHLLGHRDNLYAFIDDFKYNYQDLPKYNQPMLDSMKELQIPHIIFEGSWQDIITTYFTNEMPRSAQSSH